VVEFALPLPLLIIGACSLVLFIAVTVLAHQQGLFDGDSLGVGAMFALTFYLLFWLAPTLLAWAVWATWWKP
jgi:hypothetical protein